MIGLPVSISCSAHRFAASTIVGSLINSTPQERPAAKTVSRSVACGSSCADRVRKCKKTRRLIQRSLLVYSSPTVGLIFAAIRLHGIIVTPVIRAFFTNDARYVARQASKNRRHSLSPHFPSNLTFSRLQRPLMCYISVC